MSFGSYNKRVDSLDFGGYGGTSHLDAFGRLRVSNVTNLISTQFQYDKGPLFWSEQLTNGGTSTHLPNESSISLTVPTTNGASVVRQSKVPARYQPGKSLLVMCSMVLGSAVANVRKRVGLFDTQNGIFLEQTGSGVSFVRRTFVTGSAVDNAVAQASWNIDKFDGTGPSEITLDFSTSHIMIVDVEWLGAGTVRCGFVINGQIVYAHEFNNANSLTTVYMTHSNLPIRYEIANTALSAGATLKQICAAAMSEGGYTDAGVIRSANTGTASKSAAAAPTETPLISIRLRSDRIRGIIIPHAINFLINSADGLRYRILLNATLTGASWADKDNATSIAQVDTSATSFTGGTELQAGYISEVGREGSPIFVESNFALGSDVAGVADILTVVASQVAGAGSAQTFTEIKWREIF